MPDNQRPDSTVAETIARAIESAGVKVVTYVPGTGGNEVFDCFNSLGLQPFPVSLHEEAAYTLAHGAALTGTRSACLFKSHGLVKAGNSVSDSLYCGTTAGLVVLIFEDSTGNHSDSILDIRSFLEGIGLPYQVARADRLSGQLLRAFEQSERDSLPQALVVESGDISNLVPAIDQPVPAAALPQYQRDITLHVLCPFFAGYQHQVLQSKKAGTDWRQIPRPVLPSLPGSVPVKWRMLVDCYTGLFRVFQSIRGSVVTGDTGVSTLFACEPFNCVDISTYYGGSIPLAAGAFLGGCRDAWAVTGDFAFIAAGHLGLLEARQRGIPLKVLILNNGKAETTGGQPLPAGTLETVLSGYNRYVKYIHNPDNGTETEQVLRLARESSELCIVVADYRKG
ncbi:MAG: hypothetical protein JXA46_11130 [Dehalococcoidales bacterium]|nr:hypothetical protein [Dehalococcoidales bacterium]